MADPRAQINTFDPFEDHVVIASVFDEIVDFRQVRRRKRRAYTRFFGKHADVVSLRGQRGVHLFNRNWAREPIVATYATAPNIRHATGTRNLDELVARSDHKPWARRLCHTTS